MIGFHGDDDFVAIPYYREENSPSNNTFLTTTNLCLAGEVTVTHSTGPGKPSDFLAIGTYNLYRLITQFGQKAEIYIDCTMMHGINDLDDNFGITPAPTTLDDITVYTVVRACIFFQSLLTKPNSAIPGPSRFINQANNRYNYISGGQCLSTNEAVADITDPILAIDRTQCSSCNDKFVTDCNQPN